MSRLSIAEASSLFDTARAVLPGFSLRTRAQFLLDSREIPDDEAELPLELSGLGRIALQGEEPGVVSPTVLLNWYRATGVWREPCSSVVLNAEICASELSSEVGIPLVLHIHDGDWCVGLHDQGPFWREPEELQAAAIRALATTTGLPYGVAVSERGVQITIGGEPLPALRGAYALAIPSSAKEIERILGVLSGLPGSGLTKASWIATLGDAFVPLGVPRSQRFAQEVLGSMLGESADEISLWGEVSDFRETVEALSRLGESATALIEVCDFSLRAGHSGDLVLRYKREVGGWYFYLNGVSRKKGAELEALLRAEVAARADSGSSREHA